MSSDDLLDHFKLEAEIFSDYTVHPSYKLNRTRRVQEKIETRWYRKESIGEGAFGQVWREVSSQRDGHQDVRAVKVIEKARMRTLSIDHKKELLALAKFSKPEYQNAEVLVSLMGWFENDQSVFLAMEYFEHGDLGRHIPSISTEDEVRQITINLLEGLKIIHAEGFTHRDLKPQNIFVVEKPPQSEGWWVKIGDFGISKRIKNDETALRTQTGTPYFQAPEIQGFIESDNESSEYSNAVDLWSLGCIVYNISAGRVPFSKSYEINSYCRGRFKFAKDPLISRLSAAGITFVERLLAPEPAQRMTIQQGSVDTWILSTSKPDWQSPPLTTSNNHPTAKSDEMATRLASAYGDHGRRPRIVPDQDTMVATPRLAQTSDGANDGADRTIVYKPKTDTRKHTTVPRTLVNRSDQSAAWTNETSEKQLPSLLNHHITTANTTPYIARTLPGSKTLDVGEWQQLCEFSSHSDWVTTVAFSPDGTLLASGSYDKTVRLWDTGTGETRCTLLGHYLSVRAVAFSPDSTLLASGCGDYTVRLWDIATGEIRHTLSGHNFPVETVAFSPDGTLLASGPYNKAVRLWDIETGDICTLRGHNSEVETVAFSPDGTLLASGSNDNTIRLWDTVTGETRRTLLGHSSSVRTVAFSPDGTLLASGSGDKTVRLWDMATGETRRILLGHSSSVKTVAFSPDGTLLASGSDDKTVRLWDMATGETRRTLTGHYLTVYAVTFSPDGTLLASGSYDKTVRLWGPVTQQIPMNEENEVSVTNKRRGFLKKLFQ